MDDSVGATVTFDFEEFMAPKWDQDVGIPSLENMENVCKYYLKGTCQRGSACPNRHPTLPREKTVCRHWLRGLCRKDDACDFLHAYKADKIPECNSFALYGQCNNIDCKFRHVDPRSRIRECPWYIRGFCKLGPSCPYKHVKKIACKLYLFGFCPEGPQCKFEHVSFELQMDNTKQPFQPEPQSRFLGRSVAPGACFKCGEIGHFAASCPLNMSSFRSHPPHPPVPISTSTIRPIPKLSN